MLYERDLISPQGLGGNLKRFLLYILGSITLSHKNKELFFYSAILFTVLQISQQTLLFLDMLIVVFESPPFC